MNRHSHSTWQPRRPVIRRDWRMTGRRGSLLILMLWSLAVFTVFSITLGVGARIRATLLARLELHDSLYLIAYAGVEKARSLVLKDETKDLDSLNEAWASNKLQFDSIPTADGAFTVGYATEDANKQPVLHFGAEDEERKINLNKADPAVIAKLIELAAEVDKDTAEELSFNIVDWRDSDSAFESPTYGAEKEYYDQLPMPYACKDSPLESLDELLLIKGMKRDIFDKIKPFVTVYGTGSVNVNTASKTVLMALGLEERTVDKILALRAGPDHEDGTADDVAFPQAQAIVQMLEKGTPTIDGAEAAALSNLILSEKLGTMSTAFYVHSRAKAHGPAFLDVEAAFDRKGKMLYSKTTGVQWPLKASS